MNDEYQYAIQYDFVLKWIDLYINRKTFWLKVSDLRECFKSPLIYENGAWDLIVLNFYFDNKNIVKEWDSWLLKELNWNIEILLPNKFWENYDRWKPETYFQCAVYLLFFIFNIALPWSFEIRRAEYHLWTPYIKKKNDNNIYILNVKYDDENKFDFYTTEDFSDMWEDKDIVELEDMPLKDVIEWTKQLKIWFNQLSNKNNRLESAIYGFYNLFLKQWFDNADMSIEKVLYSTLIMEALYDAPKESIWSILFKRILFLIWDNIVNESKLKKAFYGFYDLRSQIIHWVYQIHNPIIFDDFDVWMGKVWEDLRNKNIISMYSVIILSFQSIIKRNLTRIEFIETLK